MFDAFLAECRELIEQVLADLKKWWYGTKQRHLRALVAHPHHYAVALGITLILFLFGMWERGAITGAWCYALLENLATLGEE
jgi:hypothetical protein